MWCDAIVYRERNKRYNNISDRTESQPYADLERTIKHVGSQLLANKNFLIFFVIRVNLLMSLITNKVYVFELNRPDFQVGSPGDCASYIYCTTLTKFAKCKISSKKVKLVIKLWPVTNLLILTNKMCAFHQIFISRNENSKKLQLMTKKLHNFNIKLFRHSSNLKIRQTSSSYIFSAKKCVKLGWNQIKMISNFF
jgi:hypothetical protein